MPEEIKFFDNLEARYQDEKAYEPFADYISACEKQFGDQFVSLTAEPFVLTLKDQILSIVDGKINQERI